MLIVIEGADGVGKDTVANILAKHLGAERLNFPNDKGVTGPMIREYLARRWRVEARNPDSGLKNKAECGLLGALAFQGLQVTNRMEVMPQLLEASVGLGDLVLARYWQSAWVYGQLDGLDPEFLIQVHRAMARAQVNLLLDCDAEVCLERRATRDGALAPERYEGKLESTKRIVDLYRELWARPDVTTFGQWVKVDAARPLHEVVADVAGLFA